MQTALHIAAHGPERGEDANHSRGEKRERGHAGNYAPVQVNGACEGQFLLNVTPQQLNRCLSQQQSEDRADAAQQEALDDGLLQQTSAAGSQRGTDSLFASARNRPRQHEAGNVEAGQRPDAEDHAIDQRERLANLLVQRLLVLRDRDSGSNGWAVCGLFGNNCLCASELIGELRDGHAVGQPCVEFSDPRYLFAAD